jgi:hypothetical protein
MSAIKPKRDGLEERARATHRERLAGWGDPVDPGFAFDIEHEQHVVADIVAWAEGREPRPQTHWHAFEGVGMCTICDAAAVADRLEEAEEAAMTTALLAVRGKDASPEPPPPWLRPRGIGCSFVVSCFSFGRLFRTVADDDAAAA